MGRISSDQHDVWKSIWAPTDAAQMQGVQQLKGPKICWVSMFYFLLKQLSNYNNFC